MKTLWILFFVWSQNGEAHRAQTAFESKTFCEVAAQTLEQKYEKSEAICVNIILKQT